MPVVGIFLNVRPFHENQTRFAPSPTGCVHVGGARLLYSWLLHVTTAVSSCCVLKTPI
ncbi:glutamate--tRNA ligase family protein [Escherichia coli]